MAGPVGTAVGVGERPPPTGATLLPASRGLLVGLGAAVLGLLPWLVTGARLPIQNLWASDTPPEQLPTVLLPFSQYAIILLIVVIVTGAGVAGLLARVLAPRLRRGGVPAIAVATVTVHVAALLQTATVVHAGLQDRRESLLYLAVLVFVATLSILVGALALVLVARGSVAAAVVGLSITALASGPWCRGLLVPFGALAPSSSTVSLVGATRWVPAVLVGALVAWSGLRTAGRVVAAVVGLLLLWVVPAITTAIASSAGSRVLAHQPREMARYAVEVLTRASTTPVLVLPPLVLAVAVAAAGLLGRHVLSTRPAGERPGALSSGS